MAHAAQTMALLLLLWFSTGWTLFYGLPLLARHRFVARVVPVRDELVDAILGDRLDAGDRSVDALRRVLQATVAHPEWFGLTEAFSVHVAHQRAGLPIPGGPSARGLPREQQVLLAGMRDRLGAALRVYLVFGSRFWPLVGLAVVVRRVAVGRLRRRPDRGAAPALLSTAELADDVVEAAESRIEDTPRGNGSRLLLAGT